MPEITSDKLNELDQIRQNHIPGIEQNNEYVKGRNPPTLEAKSTKPPDNRITIPLAKIAVESVCGYAGRAGDISQRWERADESELEADPKLDAYRDIQKGVAEYNEEPLELSELYHTALTQGVAYELLWISDELDLPDGVMTPEYKIIDNREIALIWSDDIKPELEACIRFWGVIKSDSRGRKKGRKYADVYYPEKSERWEKDKDDEDWTRNEKGDTEYPYKSVPLAIYRINVDELSLFQAEKPLIDGSDKLLNKSVNEVDRFNAAITLFPGKVDKGFIDKLSEIMSIDDLEQFENWPSYLQKDLTGVNEFYTDLANRLEKLFYKSVKVPDFADKDFLTADSGIALAFKLTGLEFVVSKIEVYFLRGLKTRNELINDVFDESTKINSEEFLMYIDTKRNLPVDKKSAVELAVMLNGILPIETILRILPQDIVEDVEKELAKIEGAEPEEDDIQLSIDED